jgi:3',5'-cyclic AMP phosphodiesterase CpdA
VRWLVALGCALVAATLVAAPTLIAAPAPASASGSDSGRTFIADGEPGRMICGAPPAGWQRADFDDKSWQPRAAVVDHHDGGAPYEVEAPDAGAPCGGARFARWRFRVGAELAKLQTITLRIKYTHGFAAYVNGVEIGRRRLDPAAPPDATASDVHGPEYESFVAPARVLVRGDNVLAVEVHPRTAGRDTTVQLSLGGDDGPRIVRGPYLLGLSERQATVVFDTDLPTAAELRYGTTDEYGSKVSDAFGTHHVLQLANLAPGTVYHYRVLARATGLATDDGDAVFHTPPDGGRPLRFAVYGDVRSGHDIHAALNRSLADEEADFAILTGDLVDRGSDEGDWERFFDIAAPLLRQLAIFPAIGNHEYASRGKGLVAYMQYFRWPLHTPDDEPPWYSFDIGTTHLVSLDSNAYRTPRQLSWLDRDLRDARKRGAKAIFVYAHEGPASAGMHGDNAICAREYVPLLERHKVSMFFGGHDHDYERGRTGALDYVVTGGGGAELRVARCGVPGKRACAPRVATFVNDHNYVMVEVLPSLFRVCAKRVDGTAIEPCVQYPLK